MRSWTVELKTVGCIYVKGICNDVTLILLQVANFVGILSRYVFMSIIKIVDCCCYDIVRNYIELSFLLFLKPLRVMYSIIF